ncbi:hypothetical protein JTE90_022739 [Oedothorax gibbosus]|uniref:Uncharacterized protein n=1 Tax=Oedothorax gibbosus TaxID=931172 RepID=A0AAV6US72_9ARAC|nr:hypothetical protein JTE90_022739 [Oedothorax gibbosus]
MRLFLSMKYSIKYSDIIINMGEDYIITMHKPDEYHKHTIDDFNNREQNRFSRNIYLVIFGLLGIVVFCIFVCCCYLFFAWRRKVQNRRQLSNAALIHGPPPRIVVTDFGSGDHGSTNFAFELQDAALPDYSAVTLPSPPVGDATNRPRYPKVAKFDKMVETPPPEYITVSPFK